MRCGPESAITAAAAADNIVILQVKQFDQVLKTVRLEEEGGNRGRRRRRR